MKNWWWKSATVNKNSIRKEVKGIIFENSNIIAFQSGVVHSNRTSGSKIRAIRRLEIGRQKIWLEQEISVIPYRPPRQGSFAKLPENV